MQLNAGTYGEFAGSFGTGILNLDIIPTELVNRQGVIFIVPVDAKDEGGAQ